MKDRWVKTGLTVAALSVSSCVGVRQPETQAVRTPLPRPTATEQPVFGPQPAPKALRRFEFTPTPTIEVVDPSFESAYQSYLNSFAELAVGDPEAEMYLGFFKDRRKKAKLVGEDIVTIEEGTVGRHFFTAIVDPKTNKAADRGLGGPADFRTHHMPPVLLLRNTEMTPTWKGALLGHEALLVHQHLTGLEKSRPNGSLIADQEAYDFEIRLVDRATNGRFKQVLSEQSKKIAQGANRGQLSDEDMARLSALFPPALSEAELNLRETMFLIGINFALEEQRVSDLEAAKKAKATYIQRLKTGEIPMIPLPRTPVPTPQHS